MKDKIKNVILRMQKKKRLLWFISIIHAVVMLAAVLYYATLPYTLGDEITLIETTAIIKNALFKAEEKPSRDRFLFVNCAWEKQLIPKLDSNNFEVGTIDITNRESLGKLVKAFNAKPDNHEFLLIDVRFYLESPYDSLLKTELPKLKNAIVSYHKGPDNKPHYPIFKAPLGLSDMQSQLDNNQDDLMLKYHLIQGDTLKTTPLLIYEKLHKDTVKHKLLFDELGGRTIFNSFIIEHPIRKYDLFDAPDSLRYAYTHLGELVSISDDYIHEMTKDRIVVVGDFEDLDIHRTIYGKQPGPLILVNAFLSLENGDNTLSLGFVVFVLFTFAIASFKALSLRDPVTVFLESKLPTDHYALEFTRDTLFYLIYFGIVSVVSYVFFKTHLTILVLSFYMNSLEQGLISLSGIEEDAKKKKEESSSEAEKSEEEGKEAKEEISE